MKLTKQEQVAFALTVLHIGSDAPGNTTLLSIIFKISHKTSPEHHRCNLLNDGSMDEQSSSPCNRWTSALIRKSFFIFEPKAFQASETLKKSFITRSLFSRTKQPLNCWLTFDGVIVVVKEEIILELENSLQTQSFNLFKVFCDPSRLKNVTQVLMLPCKIPRRYKHAMIGLLMTINW